MKRGEGWREGERRGEAADHGRKTGHGRGLPDELQLQLVDADHVRGPLNAAPLF